jgi:hypothetical protein
LDTLKSRSEILGKSFNVGWRRMEKISWILLVKIEEVLHGVKKERNILLTVNMTQVNRIGHFFG